MHPSPRFLKWIPFFLLALLTACGGENSAPEAQLPESRLAVTPINSRVALGTGVGARNPAGFTVRTSTATSGVSAEGQVTTMIFEEGPQFAEVLDARGRTVMMAFVSPDEPDFSALSTAKAVAYLALAGPWLKEEGRLKLLDEADTLAGFSQLQAALQAQLDGAGYINLQAAEVQSGLQLMINSALGSGQGGLHARVRPLGVIAEPTTASGLSLDTTLDTSVNPELVVENVYLRRVSLFFRQLSHVDADGTEVNENNQFTRIDMKNVAHYAGFIGTLDSVIKNEVAYTPTRTDPLDIRLSPSTAKSTTYQIFAIGSGFSSNPALVSVPADIIAAQEYLEVKTLFLDAFLVFVANVALPLAGDQIDAYMEFASANAVMTDIISTLRSTVPGLWDNLAAGDYWEAFKTLATATYTSGTILPAVGQMTLDFLWVNSSIDVDGHERIFKGMDTVLKKMGQVDAAFTVVDIGLLFRDIGNSYKIEQFLVTTTPGKLTLEADESTLRPDESTTIDAIVFDGDADAEYEYQWSVSPNGNYALTDSFGDATDISTGGLLVTSDSRVTLRSLVTSGGIATVSVKVYRLDGGRRLFGEKSLAVKFEVLCDVDPGNPNCKLPGLANDWFELKALGSFTGTGSTVAYEIVTRLPACHHKYNGNAGLWDPAPCYTEVTFTNSDACGYIHNDTHQAQTTSCGSLYSPRRNWSYPPLKYEADTYNHGRTGPATTCGAAGNFYVYAWGGGASDPQQIWSARGPTALKCRATWNTEMPNAVPVNTKQYFKMSAMMHIVTSVNSLGYYGDTYAYATVWVPLGEP